MVVALGPGKFYGSSLPRPRIYTDVKLNSERVDPPVPVLDPLMSWAQEAHWSMGGLSFKRLRLQGRIEGNVNKLRSQRENSFNKKQKTDPIKPHPVSPGSDPSLSPPSPPPAPIAVKRKRFLEDNEKDDREIRRRLTRKLGDDFDRVAEDSVVEDVNKVKLKGNKLRGDGESSGGIRASPRLAKRRLSLN